MHVFQKEYAWFITQLKGLIMLPNLKKDEVKMANHDEVVPAEAMSAAAWAELKH